MQPLNYTSAKKERGFTTVSANVWFLPRRFALVALFAVCVTVSLMLGRYPITPGELASAVASRIPGIAADLSGPVAAVVFEVRLPRVMAAVLVGASLSSAGVAYQSLFQNPMVSPDVLGASAGAGFGAALGIMFSLSSWGVSLLSFSFGIVAVSVSFAVSSRVKGDPTVGLVLAGIMIGSLFSSGISFLKLIADPMDKLPSITYWLMGSLASIRTKDVQFAAFPVLIGVVPLFLLRWRLNILTMGEEEARSLGIRTGRLRLVVICAATLATSASVAVSGMIGWVGLVIPHFARMTAGTDTRSLVPASILLGGSFLLIVDDLARLLASSEIPLGILTSFVGVPFFLAIIMGKRGGGGWCA